MDHLKSMSLWNVQVSSGSDFHPAEEIVGAEGAADREPTWTFLTNHARVLVILAGNPRARIRDIAATIGITERAAHGIITDLVQEGYVERVREGRRNRYAVVPGRHLRDPSQNTVPVQWLIDLSAGTVAGPDTRSGAEAEQEAEAPRRRSTRAARLAWFSPEYAGRSWRTCRRRSRRRRTCGWATGCRSGERDHARRRSRGSRPADHRP